MYSAYQLLSEPRLPIAGLELLEYVSPVPLDQIPLKRLALPNGLHRRLHHHGGAASRAQSAGA
jgi:hypothetical protein